MKRNSAALSLIAFDLDGTAIDSTTRKMSPRVQDALERAHDEGIQIVVASGRPLSMVGWLCEATWVDWLVLLNGSLICRRSNPADYFCSPLEKSQVTTIIEILSDLKPAWIVFYPEKTYREELMFEYMARPGRESILPGTNTEKQLRTALVGTTFVKSVPEVIAATDEPICKFEFIVADLSHMTIVPQRLAPLGLELANVGPGEFEITARGVNKGIALSRICHEEGLDPAKAAGFGDSYNDLTMMGHIGTFVAVANARPEVREAADEVCPSIDKDGIAVWLESHLYS